jgi:hypothetical protein
VLKPLLRGIVVPRIDELNRFSANLLSGKLFGREFVQEVVFVLLSKIIKAMLEIRLNDLNGNLSLLSLILETLFLLTHTVVGKSPDTELTKKGLDVFLNGLQEISVIKVKNTLDKVTNEDTNHPDLLILHETYGTLI